MTCKFVRSVSTIFISPPERQHSEDTVNLHTLGHLTQSQLQSPNAIISYHASSYRHRARRRRPIPPMHSKTIAGDQRAA